MQVLRVDCVIALEGYSSNSYGLLAALMRVGLVMRVDGAGVRQVLARGLERDSLCVLASVELLYV